VQAANDEAKPNWRWRSGLSDGSSLRTRRQQLGTTTTSKLLLLKEKKEARSPRNGNQLSPRANKSLF
jgi:hypothetical protein